MPDNSGFIEKREHERITSRMRVDYETLPEAEIDRLIASKAYHDISLGEQREIKVKDVLTVVTENISVGGLMIIGPKPFKAGQTMRLELHMPQAPLPIKCLGVVVRESAAQGAGGYSAGIRFLGINKDDVAKIQRYVAMQRRAEMERGR